MGRKNKPKGGDKPIFSKNTRSEASPAPAKRAKIAVKPVQETKTTLSSRHEKSSRPHITQPPPPSVPSSHILLPPESDDPKIRINYDIHTISVHASSKIESKVRQVLAVRAPKSEDGKGNVGGNAAKTKAKIVALTARAPAGNKCISIAEIAKREVVKEGRRCWQYTGFWTRLEKFELKEKTDLGRDKTQGGEPEAGAIEDEDGDEDEEDEEPAFETQKDPEKERVRNAVCLVIYLSGEPVGRLRELYGEQAAEVREG